MSKSLFAIFGNPVHHSKSPLMHNLTFKYLKINSCYGRYLLNDGKKLKSTFLNLGLKGINITVPHKESAFEACDVVDDFAQRVGAVNTIVNKNGKLYGYNTDAPGFLKAISVFKNIKTVLLLGAGGTTKSTSSLLRDNGYDITILNRSQSRLEPYINNGFKTFTHENFTYKNVQYDLIINMTSAGLEDDRLPAPIEILEELIPHTKACVDVIYGQETPFLRLSKKHNKPVTDGSDMLLYQGIIAFQYFTDSKYSFKEIELHMKRAFII